MWPVFKPERSRDWVLGAVGNDAASSAQLKHAGGGVEHGGTEVEGGEMRDGGHKMVAVGGVDPFAVVKMVEAGEHAR